MGEGFAALVLVGECGNRVESALGISGIGVNCCGPMCVLACAHTLSSVRSLTGKHRFATDGTETMLLGYALWERGLRGRVGDREKRAYDRTSP